MAQRLAAALLGGEREIHGQPLEPPTGWQFGAVSRVMRHDVAIGRDGGRCLPGHLPGGQRGCDHRRLDSDFARAGTGGPRHRELEEALSPLVRAGKRLQQLLGCCSADRSRWRCRSQPELVAVESVSAAPPGHNRVVRMTWFRAQRRPDGLGIIGPSALRANHHWHGLSRRLAAVPGQGPVGWRHARTMVARVSVRHVGYLPQDVELFEGTIAENIARFEPEPAARCRSSPRLEPPTFTSLSSACPTATRPQIGEGGSALSAGQRQRIALGARSLSRSVSGRA